MRHDKGMLISYWLDWLGWENVWGKSGQGRKSQEYDEHAMAVFKPRIHVLLVFVRYSRRTGGVISVSIKTWGLR